MAFYATQTPIFFSQVPFLQIPVNTDGNIADAVAPHLGAMLDPGSFERLRCGPDEMSCGPQYAGFAKEDVFYVSAATRKPGDVKRISSFVEGSACFGYYSVNPVEYLSARTKFDPQDRINDVSSSLSRGAVILFSRHEQGFTPEMAAKVALYGMSKVVSNEQPYAYAVSHQMQQTGVDSPSPILAGSNERFGDDIFYALYRQAKIWPFGNLKNLASMWAELCTHPLRKQREDAHVQKGKLLPDRMIQESNRWEMWPYHEVCIEAFRATRVTLTDQFAPQYRKKRMGEDVILDFDYLSFLAKDGCSPNAAVILCALVAVQPKRKDECLDSILKGMKESQKEAACVEERKMVYATALCAFATVVPEYTYRVVAELIKEFGIEKSYVYLHLSHKLNDLSVPGLFNHSPQLFSRVGRENAAALLREKDQRQAKIKPE